MRQRYTVMKAQEEDRILIREEGELEKGFKSGFFAFNHQVLLIASRRCRWKRKRNFMKVWKGKRSLSPGLHEVLYVPHGDHGALVAFVPKVAEVFAAPKQRPPVIWLHFGECTGCSEALLRSMYPWIDELVLEILSVEYHETIMAAAGHQAEENLHAMPSKNTPASSSASSKARLPPSSTAATARSPARASLRSPRKWCPSRRHHLHRQPAPAFGGVPAAKPNPGGYKGVGDAHRGQNPQPSRLPAQPHQPGRHHGQLPAAGQTAGPGRQGRPLFAYGKTIHDTVPPSRPLRKRRIRRRIRLRRSRHGLLPVQMGCRGPETYNNCPIAKFNDGTSWPVEAGHPCIGCSEPISGTP
jgi:[NiFe] hydrogenase small subunit